MVCVVCVVCGEIRSLTLDDQGVAEGHVVVLGHQLSDLMAHPCVGNQLSPLIRVAFTPALCEEAGENWREVWSREFILVSGTSLECHSSTPPCHANALLLERLTSQWCALRYLVHAVVRSQWSCRRHGWLVTSQPPSMCTSICQWEP